MTTRTRKATTPRQTRSPRHAPELGESGRLVKNIGGAEVEIVASHLSADGEEFITSIVVPIPGEIGWAIVQRGSVDGSSWMVGIDGWQHDEFTGLHEAIAAVCDRTVRRQVLARTAHFWRLYDLERQVRELREAAPPAPAGAVPSVDSWEVPTP